MLTVLADAFLSIGLPIICGVVGLILGATAIILIPLFKKQRANAKAAKIIREAEIDRKSVV